VPGLVHHFLLYLPSERSAVTLEELEFPFDESGIATARLLWMAISDPPNGCFDRSEAAAVRSQFGDHSFPYVIMMKGRKTKADSFAGRSVGMTFPRYGPRFNSTKFSSSRAIF
jgi:hypothetical protein